MNGEDLFRGLNYVNAKFIDEAENVTQLKGEKKILSVRRTVLIAAIVALMLFLLGCAVVRLISMQVQDTQIYMPDGQTHVGEEVRFEETDDVFIELGAYYPQQIPDGYSMIFVSEGAPLQRQSISYENTEGQEMDFQIMIGDPASSVEIYDITNKTDVDINGQKGILYEQSGGTQTLVWIAENQGFGFVLRTDDSDLDLLSVARSTAPGEPLVPTRSESTVKALAELGDFSPTYLPEGYEEQGIMGCPLEEGGGWYSYMRKWYVNKTENTRIYFEYETYAIDTEMGYEDNAKTVCSFFIPGSNALDGSFLGDEIEVSGMYGLAIGNHIAWADPEKHVVYHLTSEDVLGEELFKVAQSISDNS